LLRNLFARLGVRRFGDPRDGHDLRSWLRLPVWRLAWRRKNLFVFSTPVFYTCGQKSPHGASAGELLKRPFYL
ncbi:MAG: hypothetical protein ACKOTE_17125, partial [Opitutaceae bacterium]